MQLEQNNINKRSGRKCSDYEKLEKEFQDAQNHWDEFEDKESWQKMFSLINLATFNLINKKLEHILDRETIEERALDVCLTIMKTLSNKRKKGKEWKIEKVSSAVYLPCLAIYDKQLQFEDKIRDQSSYTVFDEDGKEIMAEYSDSFVSQGTGVYHLHYEG